MYIHKALNELITCGETEIAAVNMRIAIGLLSRTVPGQVITGFQAQLQVNQFSIIDFGQSDSNSSTATSEPEVNTPKNCYQNKIPCE